MAIFLTELVLPRSSRDVCRAICRSSSSKQGSWLHLPPHDNNEDTDRE